MSSPNAKTPGLTVPSGSEEKVDQVMQPVLFEIFGEMWKVQARLGQGGSASVYRVSSARSSSAAVKEFLLDAQGGDYGFLKERSVLEDIQGHKNIGKADLLALHHDYSNCALLYQASVAR